MSHFTPFRHIPALTLLAALSASPSALAEQTSPQDQAAAEALFREAKRLIKEGHFGDACPKLLESQRLDPAPGTALNLGDCYEQNGQTASAWAAFIDAQALARKEEDKKRQDEAARRASALEPRLSKMKVRVPEEARAPGLSIRRDEQELGAALWGTAVPVDPGRHVIEAQAPGRKAFQAQVEVPREAVVVEVVVPVLTEERGSSPAKAKREDKARGGWGAQKTAGLVVGGVGLAGVVVGAVLGAQTLSKTGESDPHCSAGEPIRCDSTGLALREEAKTTANVANVAFAVGGAALVGGVVLFLTAPSGEKNKAVSGVRVGAGPVVGMGMTGLSVRGEW